MYQIIQYFKFLISSTNKHGVHSPFVYDLTTKCLNTNFRFTQYRIIKSYRKALIKIKTIIIINDLGSGSKFSTSNNRSVRSIAKTAGSTIKKAKLLYRISNYFKGDDYLELGTSLGIGTFALSQGNPKANIVSVEGDVNIHKIAKQQLKTFKVDNVKLVNSDFSSFIKTAANKKLDLVFIDGHHTKAATISYFQDLLKYTHNDSVFIIDDIYWSKEMTEAWNDIKLHPACTVTIDTFYLGLVFFRKEQVKQHFKIRV
ncbi:MAG: class I SAM-dependent methyltransferase [Winogradskyella sp.]|nr:class I SAM-dependent methyltransferase [Winogradskyella sp.]